MTENNDGKSVSRSIQTILDGAAEAAKISSDVAQGKMTKGGIELGGQSDTIIAEQLRARKVRLQQQTKPNDKGI